MSARKCWLSSKACALPRPWCGYGPAGKEPRRRLTERERQVVQLVSKGSSNKEIADALYISVDAVKTHLRALFQLFELADLPQNQKRARLVERAFNLGVVTPRDL